MSSISKPFRLVVPGTVFAYGMLLMPLAQAQTAPVVPIPVEPVPVTAPVPAPVAPKPSTIPNAQIEKLDFKDVDVAELLTVLAQQFNVDILVTGDVTGTLKYINLNNKTPEEAIKRVVAAAGLQYRYDNGTYTIGKSLPADPNAPAPAPAISPLLPLNSGNPTILPGGALAAGPMAPLPSFGGNDQLPTLIGPNPYATDNISLSGNTSRNKGKQTPIHIRNVKPSTIAYWLDPTHNALPMELQASQMNAKNYGKQNAAELALGAEAQTILNNSTNTAVGTGLGLVTPGYNPYIQSRAAGQMVPEVQSNAQFGGGFGGGGGIGGGRGGGFGGGGGGFGGRGGGQNSVTFDLPGDIEQIIAVDPQNILLVAGGTDEDIRRLQEIINVLDRPLRQVEIEAQFVQVTTTDTRSFGIDFTTSQGNFDANTVGLAPALAATSGGFQLGFVRNNFQATLNALINRNRAKILTAPRVLAINNLTASIYSTTQTPIVLTTAVAGGGLNGNTATGNNLLYISTSIGLSVTPTINNDDTITVLMQPQLSTQTPGSNSVGAPSLTTQSVFTVANVRDGDTIALGGLRLKTITRGGSKIPVLGDIPLLGKLFQSRNALDNDDQLIIFLKATIIRRFGDDEPVPGT